MNRTGNSGPGRTVITSWRPLEFHSRDTAIAFIRDITSSGGGITALRDALAEKRPSLVSFALSDEDTIREVADLLVNGEIRIMVPPGSSGPVYWGVRQDPPPDETEVEKTQASSEVATEKIVSWIEIELVGEDGSPIPNERFSIRLPDGKLEEGTLDADGKTRFDDIPSGNCFVSFPDLDEDAWEAV